MRVEDDESNSKTGLKNAGPAWAAKQATHSTTYLFLFYSLALSPSPHAVSLFSHRDDAADAPRQKRFISIVTLYLFYFETIRPVPALSISGKLIDGCA
jgi:hypothetical protein